MAEIDLNFLVRQSERILATIAELRDEQRVQSAMLLRLDARIGGLDTTMSTMHAELRAIREQITRVIDRVHKLEDQQ